ncbi:unnamed protein product [Microthlaspi erraticum]|uniref:Uncharacterized protein n=1 Tax=Microthlaspi erraticum TaxID=1685480 RepID=A0A6D2J3D1_9BRAS|nr:unnamed protein product [Microthlaspi erraticum]
MVFQTDCSDVVKMVSKPEEWPAFSTLFDEVDRCKRRFTSFNIMHIPRTNNTKADKLARTLNEIYAEEEDYDRLRESIDLHDSFDQIGLAQKIEKHSAYIYKKAGRWKQSIALSKKDMYKDCMETASQSGDHDLAEQLLVYFIEQFIREYSGKVDELIKDKLEARKEVKAKEQKEKDVMSQQVLLNLHRSIQVTEGNS